jgi:hypothetical protein
MVEVEMRKEDRIRQQQSQSDQAAEPKKPSREEEKVKGGAGMDQPSRTQHPGGKLPIPD